MPRHIDQKTLASAIDQLKGTAGVFFRIWLVLKKMGFTKDNPIEVTTVNGNDASRELFWYGDDKYLFTPFTETSSDWKMRIDAGRSVIQTNVRQWADKTGTKNPPFLDVRDTIGPGGSKPLIVRAEENYPVGLGMGANGFAVRDGVRVTVPKVALAVWVGRTTAIPDDVEPEQFLVDNLEKSLNLSAAEMAAVFIDKPLSIGCQISPLSDSQLKAICDGTIKDAVRNVAVKDTPEEHRSRIQAVQTINDRPSWLNSDPAKALKQALDEGAKAILLYGPPRTGKTRALDQLWPRTDTSRITIQIHDGWGYEQLIQGLFPKDDGTFDWRLGRLAQAIEDGKKLIVLEEINRTLISQSLGEVFSLIEDAYRGSHYAITLRDGSDFYIPEDVTFVMTMNTVDKSTEEVDDALLGRFVSIEYPPRVEDLASMLSNGGISAPLREKLCRVFSEIQSVYPLGHGYFAGYKDSTDPLFHYRTRIRPVLSNHLSGHNDHAMGMIDLLVDEVFGI